jgi:cytochrome c553
MRKLLGMLMLVLVPAVGPAAENGLKWAYPVEPPPGTNVDAAPPSRRVNQALIAASYTGLPKMPEVVAKGKPLPCMQCYLANGGSHPESAAISGLSVNYIIEQVHAFRDGERVDVRTGRMILASKAISEKELKEAAEYYAAIGPERQQWIKTVVSNDVPKGPAPFGGGGFRYHAPDGGTEPLPQGMVVEMAEDDDLVRARDQINGGFVQYVRADDLALGEKVATAGGCGTCHGADYKGINDVPRLAGQHAVYLIRQLKDMQIGARKDKNVALMRPALKNCPTGTSSLSRPILHPRARRAGPLLPAVAGIRPLFWKFVVTSVS